MAAASYRSERSRWRGIVLALVVEGLVALLLFSLGSGVLRKVEQPRLTTFDVAPVGEAQTRQATRTRVATRQQRRTVATPSAAPPPPVAPPLPTPPLHAPSKLIQLSPEDYASSDIGKIKSARGEGAGDEEGSGRDSVAAYGPGEGPGGAALYNAEWYREPTRAELAFYMPKTAQTGWALIACRTIPDMRVENCRSLGESPVGSGLSRALREAAWQFRVRPPRIGGKPLIGAWVRIKFDLTVGVVK